LEGEQLLLIDVVNAHGAVILQTIWGTTADARVGQPRALTSSDLGGERFAETPLILPIGNLW